MFKLNIFICVLSVLLVSCLALKPWNRIVGGQDAENKQFPHQVSLRVSGSHICGGSIINQKWILTAAHCVTYSQSLYTVVAGTNTLSKGGVISKVKKIISHEKYANFQNDIALMELETALNYNDAIQPIELAKTEVEDNGPILISGWGRIYTNGPISENLKYNTQTSKLPNDKCKSLIGSIYFDGVICLGHNSGDGACNGDSGGPALNNNKLVGVANFVMGGCGTNNADGYCKVSHYIQWIESKTGLKF